MKFEHNEIWAALDNLAQDKKMSISRMAILSDLDSTSFNKSKRSDIYGRLRWPSTETLSKVMGAMNVSWTEFDRYFPHRFKNTTRI